MNIPPSGLIFTYPQGLPGFIPSDAPFTFEVEVSSIGSITPNQGTGTLHYSFDGVSYTSVPMTPISGNLYSATIPAVECTDIVNFYVSAVGSNSVTFFDPANAPASSYSTVAATGTEITLEDGLEGDVSNWTVVNHASLTGGGWEAADPNATINAGSLASPEDDNGNGDDVKAFVTQNGAPGGAANVADVDGGPTQLLSPTLDLAGTDATISYDRWFYTLSGDTDEMVTEVSNDNGAAWVFVHSTAGTNGVWEPVNFRVGQFVTPSAQVRVRFSTTDSPNDSVTEAGVDNFIVDELVCTNPCPADVSADGYVDVNDLLGVISAWGSNGGPADITGDGPVDINDLLAVISAWGECP
jgi:hypothetical protein